MVATAEKLVGGVIGIVGGFIERERALRCDIEHAGESTFASQLRCLVGLCSTCELSGPVLSGNVDTLPALFECRRSTACQVKRKYHFATFVLGAVHLVAICDEVTHR